MPKGISVSFETWRRLRLLSIDQGQSAEKVIVGMLDRLHPAALAGRGGGERPGLERALEAARVIRGSMKELKVELDSEKPPV